MSKVENGNKKVITEEQRKRMKNVPNILSLIRILLIPILIAFYLVDSFPAGKIIALVLFCIASFSDFLDGHIARKYNVVSKIGVFLDTTADKLLVLSALTLIVVDGTVVAPWGVLVLIITLSRDLVMGAIRQIGTANGIVIAADKLGKWKATVHMVMIPLFMLLAYENSVKFMGATFHQVYEIISYVFLAVGTLLTVLSLINYMVKNKAIFKENPEVKEESKKEELEKEIETKKD